MNQVDLFAILQNNFGNILTEKLVVQ